MFMDLDDNTVREVCICAQYRKERGNDAIYCEKAQGKNPPSMNIQFFNIKKGEVCVATTFFPTGHVRCDSYVDLERMPLS